MVKDEFLMEERMSLIKFEEIKKVYRTGDIEFPALKGITFSVNKGEFMAIAGPSGSGKTTILNIVGCLDRSTDGKYFLNGENVEDKTGNELAAIRRDGIGFIFQTFNLIPILSVFENVEFPLVLKGDFSPKQRQTMVKKILEEVGISELGLRKPSELSGGQQQRVSIARALVKGPDIVLADEPTANLDSGTGEEILMLMKKLNDIRRTTFIFSTHDKMVMNFAKRLIKLKDGNIEEDSKKE